MPSNSCFTTFEFIYFFFASSGSQKGSGSTPDLTSQSTLHACLQKVNAM